MAKERGIAMAKVTKELSVQVWMIQEREWEATMVIESEGFELLHQKIEAISIAIRDLRACAY